MRTLVLPDGSIVKTIEVKAVRVHSHLWSVQVELRDGWPQDIIEHLLLDAAQDNKTQIIAANVGLCGGG